MLLAPGPYRYDFARTRDVLAADAAALAHAQPQRYGPKGPRTDAQGRCTLSGLVPGVQYRIGWQSKDGYGARDFTVKPGETLDLADVMIPDGQEG
jgi:hypothetical protein